MTIELKPIKVNNSSLPSQVQEYLRGLIRDGSYQPGYKLPPEGGLAEQLGISRPTLRKALHKLEMEGAIVRKQGIGTFVSSPNKRTESGLEVLESIERMAKRIGWEATMGTMEVEERAPSSRELTGLKRDNLVTILSVARTIQVDSRPVAYLQDCVPVEYPRKDDLGPDFYGSVLDIFLQHGRQDLAHSFTELAAVPATRLLASQLQIPYRTPLCKWKPGCIRLKIASSIIPSAISSRITFTST